MFQPGIVDGAVGDASYATSIRLSACGLYRAIKRAETINEGVFPDDTCPQAGRRTFAVSANFTVFEHNIDQSGIARQLTGNHTRLLTSNNIRPGKAHIGNPAIAIKLLDKTVSEVVNGVTAAIVLTNKRLGFAADRTGHVTGININKLTIATIARVGRVTTDFVQHATITHFNPVLLLKGWRSTNHPQARSGTKPNSRFRQLGRLTAGCPVRLFFPRLSRILVVPLGIAL